MKESSQDLDQKSSVPPGLGGGRRSSAVLDNSDEAIDWFLTRPELAERLNVSLRTVDRWVAHGHLPLYKVGTLVLFDWNEVLEHLHHNFHFTPGGDL